MGRAYQPGSEKALSLRPPLVIISGPPAGGKTTLAVPLARHLGLPLLAKDTIKEALMDALGCDSVDRSRELGTATFEVLYRLAEAQLDVGTGAAVEANFHAGASVPALSRLVARSKAVEIFCWAPDDVLIQRYRRRARSGERHLGHYDLDRIPGGPALLDPARYDMARFGVPTLRVDTSGVSGLDAILDWTREQLSR